MDSPLPNFRTHPPLTYHHWADLITDDLVRESVSLLGQWTRRSVELAEGHGHGYRDLSVDRDGNAHWSHPRSNAAERIDHWLWLADYLGEPAYRQIAIDYARWMIDHDHGLYKGPDASAVGMLYYWTEDRQYVTNYTIRVPRAFFKLSDLTGDPVFAEWATRVGDLLVSIQADTGLLPEAWTVENGWPDPVRDRDTAKINCRVGYAMGTFAELHRRTGQEKYRAAYRKLLGAMVRAQSEDGSLPHDLLVYTGRTFAACRKNHFMGYLLNGVAQAYQVFPDDDLLDFGRRVARFVIRQYAYLWSVPYLHVDDGFYYRGRQYNHGKFMAITDPAPGLAALYEITGDQQYLDVALKMFFQLYMHQYRGEHPDLFGCIPVAADSFPLAAHWSVTGEEGPQPEPPYSLYVGGYYNFEYLRLAEILVRLRQKRMLPA